MVYILGCDHWLQEPENNEPQKPGTFGELFQEIDRSPKARKQRQLFSNLIEEIICSNSIEFVGEETNQGLQTPARNSAEKYHCLYSNIEMPPDVKRQNGIPEDYQNPEKYPREQLEAWYRLRERYMFDEVRKQRGERTRSLVVCGALHMRPLAELFSKGDETVRLQDVTEAEWYLGRPSSEWLER